MNGIKIRADDDGTGLGVLRSAQSSILFNPTKRSVHRITILFIYSHITREEKTLPLQTRVDSEILVLAVLWQKY